MQVLLYRTEFQNYQKLVQQGVLHALLNIFRHYHKSQKELSKFVLKVVANIAQNGKVSADAIVDSGDAFEVLNIYFFDTNTLFRMVSITC